MKYNTFDQTTLEPKPVKINGKFYTYLEIERILGIDNKKKP